MPRKFDSNALDFRNSSVPKVNAEPTDTIILTDASGVSFKTTIREMIQIAGNGYTVSQVEGAAPYNNIQDAIDQANADWLAAGSPDTTIKVKVLVGIYAPSKGAPIDGIITNKRGVFVEWDSTAGGSPGARWVGLQFRMI